MLIFSLDPGKDDTGLLVVCMRAKNKYTKRAPDAIVYLKLIHLVYHMLVLLMRVLPFSLSLVLRTNQEKPYQKCKEGPLKGFKGFKARGSTTA